MIETRRQMREASAGELLATLADPEDHELVARFLGPLGSLAREWLHGEAALLTLSVATRARLAAAFELSRRRDRERCRHGPRMSSATDVFRLIGPRMRDETVEVFRLLVLDARHGLLVEVEISRGTLSTSLVHPREVFRPAIAAGGASVIVAHNHPSGDAEPSREDDGVTARLVEAGRILGIPVLDHVVVGEGSFVSYRERGRLGDETG
jgi:DNA repair protein RadC